MLFIYVIFSRIQALVDGHFASLTHLDLSTRPLINNASVFELTKCTNLSFLALSCAYLNDITLGYIKVAFILFGIYYTFITILCDAPSSSSTTLAQCYQLHECRIAFAIWSVNRRWCSDPVRSFVHFELSIIQWQLRRRTYWLVYTVVLIYQIS